MTRGPADMALIDKAQNLIAQTSPVLAQWRQLGKLLPLNKRLQGHGRKKICQHVVGRKKARVVEQLFAKERVAHAAPQMDKQDRRQIQGNENVFQIEMNLHFWESEFVRHRFGCDAMQYVVGAMVYCEISPGACT